SRPRERKRLALVAFLTLPPRFDRSSAVGARFFFAAASASSSARTLSLWLLIALHRCSWFPPKCRGRVVSTRNLPLARLSPWPCLGLPRRCTATRPSTLCPRAFPARRALAC